MITARKLGLAAGLLVSLWSLPGLAQQTTDIAEFDLLIRGIKAASVSFSGGQDGAAYLVTGAVRTTGVAALLKRLRYEGAASGTIAAGRFFPDHYRESADTGRRQSDAMVDYLRGVPQVTAYSPKADPQPGDVDPATMGDTVDPLTALYATLRAVDQSQTCNLSLDLFDGKRASQLRVGAPAILGDGVTCDGAYIRVAGFTPKEMANQQRFPFTLIYAPTDGGQMRVVEVTTETIYGKATLKRR
jgi:hypothetical protein